MSRFVAVAAAIALVLSGIIVGALGTFLVHQRPGHPGMGRPGPQGPPPGPGPRHPEPFTREMEMRLKLSDEQMKKIHAILEESREQADEIRRELRPKLEAKLESTRARIAEALDADQRTAFEAMVKEDKARADRFMLDGPPPGPPPPFGGPPPPPPFGPR